MEKRNRVLLVKFLDGMKKDHNEFFIVDCEGNIPAFAKEKGLRYKHK
jgi:hypothetical protein